MIIIVAVTVNLGFTTLSEHSVARLLLLLLSWHLMQKKKKEKKGNLLCFLKLNAHLLNESIY